RSFPTRRSSDLVAASFTLHQWGAGRHSGFQVDQLVGNAATVRLVAAVGNGLLDPFHARSVYFRQLTQTLFYSLQLLGLIAQTDLGVAGCRLIGILGAGRAIGSDLALAGSSTALAAARGAVGARVEIDDHVYVLSLNASSASVTAAGP